MADDNKLPATEKRAAGILTMLKVLREQTDEQHPITDNKLCQLLNTEQCQYERKAMGRYRKVLQAGNYDIIQHGSKRGCFLGERELQKTEVRLLLDAIYAAPFLSQRKTKELSEKLLQFFSIYDREQLRKEFTTDSTRRRKVHDIQIYYLLQAFQDAMDEGKKIRFQYHHRLLTPAGEIRQNQGRGFVMSPYAVVWQDDNYYVIGNVEGFDGVSIYRLDRMRTAVKLDKKAVPHENLEDSKEPFSLSEFLNTSFFMYGGDPQEVTFRCEKSLLDTMYDRFPSMTVQSQDENTFTFTAPVQCSDGFYGWVLRFGSRVQVQAPSMVQEELTRRIADLAALYGFAIVPSLTAEQESKEEPFL